MPPAAVFTQRGSPPAEAQWRRDGNGTANRRRFRIHCSSTAPLCASAPLRENYCLSNCVLRHRSLQVIQSTLITSPTQGNPSTPTTAALPQPGRAA
jgi:hypothetical protein